MAVKSRKAVIAIAVIIIFAVAAAAVAIGIVARTNVIVTGGSHPYVKGWYYEAHPHAFACKSDPYSCKECPVGQSDRVITISPTYVAPSQVNSFFGCDDINRLVPEKGYADSDTFICHREPEDGSILLNGKTIKCGK